MTKLILDGIKGAFNRLTLLLWVILIPTLVAAGPFGTFTYFSVYERFFFWGPVVVISSITGHVAVPVSRYYVPRHRPLLRDLVAVAIVTAVFTPVLEFLIAQHLGPISVQLMSPARSAATVGGITFGVMALRRMLPGFERFSYFSSFRVPEPPRLTQRLPDGESGPVLRLSVRDHFVDVVTSEGKYSLRMRFGDAIAEMDTVVGYLTHRSHWVARSAVSGVVRENGKIFLTISNGEKVPVSRTYKDALEKEGIL